MRKEPTFDESQFSKRPLPIRVKFTPTGWLTVGIDFESHLSLKQRKAAGERRKPTPTWALNNAMLRRVIVAFMEERAFSKKERSAMKKFRSLKVRLNAAQARIVTKRAAAIVVFDRLNEEYVQIKKKGLRPEISDKEWNESKSQPYMEFAEGEARYQDEQQRLRRLEIALEGLDTYLRISENGGADIVGAVAYLYYRLGLDSVGVALELGLKSPHVRIMIYRLNQTAKNLEKEGAFDKLVSRKRKYKRTVIKRGLTTPPLF
jgi:hypothetical protein